MNSISVRPSNGNKVIEKSALPSVTSETPENRYAGAYLKRELLESQALHSLTTRKGHM